MDFKNYYEILGVPADADKATIKRVYKILSQDLSITRDKNKYDKIVKAYTILENDESRMDYDKQYFEFYHNRDKYFQNVMYYTFIFLALILIIIAVIIYSTDKTKKHLKHNSLSKSSHKK